MPDHREQIETARLLLVPLSSATARAIAGGDLSAIDRADGWPHADTLDAVGTAAQNADPRPLWLVTLDGRVIGDCGTAGDVDDTGDVEIGYGLAAEYRGQGFGTEVVAAFSQWLLRQPGVRRIVADVELWNIPSQRVLERAGFVPTARGDTLVSYALAG
jgi:RimJ/RimL family protein N-acetyltransferase